MKLRSFLLALVVGVFAANANAQNAPISPEVVALVQAAARNNNGATAGKNVAAIAAQYPDAAATIAKVAAQAEPGTAVSVCSAIVTILPSSASAVVAAVVPVLPAGPTNAAMVVAGVSVAVAAKASTPAAAETAVRAVISAGAAAVSDPAIKATIAALAAKASNAVSNATAAQSAGVAETAVTQQASSSTVTLLANSARGMSTRAGNATDGITVAPVVQSGVPGYNNAQTVSDSGGSN